MLSKIVQENKRKLSEDIGEFQRERITCEQLDDAIFSSQISLLEAELERKKGMMKMTYRNALEHSYVDGYNIAIQEDITYLEEQIEEIKKLI